MRIGVKFLLPLDRALTLRSTPTSFTVDYPAVSYSLTAIPRYTCGGPARDITPGSAR